MNNHTIGAVLAFRQQRRQLPMYQTATCNNLRGCGSKPHIGGQTHCPAYKQVCHHCNKIDHFARVKQAQSTSYQLPGPCPLPNSSTKSLQLDKAQPFWISTIKQNRTVHIQILSINKSCETQALTKTTRVSTDASKLGLFILQQRTGDKWTLIQAGSRFLSGAETRYVVIELEMLSVC